MPDIKVIAASPPCIAEEIPDSYLRVFFFWRTQERWEELMQKIETDPEEKAEFEAFCERFSHYFSREEGDLSEAV